MAMIGVNLVSVRPDSMSVFEENVAKLAERAVEKKEKWTWTAHQTQIGDAGTLHFVYGAESFAEIQKLGTVQELWERLFGKSKGAEQFGRTNACLQSARHGISMERPDLSYGIQATPQQYPLAVVTTLRARTGQLEAAEELIRKIAEAIPKISDPTHLMTYQSVFGDLREIATVRPLRSLEELDKQTPVPDLLNQAFGPAEGGLVYRAGLEAIEDARRELVVYREDLSNPPRD